MTSSQYDRAIAYLRLEFSPDTEFTLTLVREFNQHPLQGPGVIEVYAFESALGSDRLRPYYVVVAKPGTVNYYPHWGLSPDEIWAVHIATEYYLFTGVRTLASTTQQQRFLNEARALADREPQFSPAASLKVEAVYHLKGSDNFAEEFHAVGKVSDGDDTWTFVVGDIPHALYHLDLPGDTVWRLHFGRQILSEP